MLLDLGNGLYIDPEAQLREFDRVDFEDSLYMFLRAAWRQMDPAPWIDGWPVEAIAEHLQAVVDGEITRLLINLPPRTGKSSICSVAFPAWLWTQSHRSPTSGPGVPILAASYSNALALRDSVRCRRLIESAWYQSMWSSRFALTTDQNTKSRFQNSEGGERLITSVDAGVTGEGGNCFVAGTMVSTPNGPVPIQRIKLGAQVISYDPLLGIGYGYVKAKKVSLSSEYVKITTLSGVTIKCTPDHLIWITAENGVSGYVKAAGLKEGDRLITTEHGECRNDFVATTERFSNLHMGIGQPFGRLNPIRVYDIQVEGYTHNYHNFFANGILVHNCIILDDPNAANEVSSEATIQRTLDWWSGTMSTRLNDAKAGAFVVVQQRLAENDLSGHILEKNVGEWTHLMLPMHYEASRSYSTSIGWKDPRKNEGDLLWPDRLGSAEVKALERALGPFGSAGQLEQRPEPKGGGIIKRDWWQLWTEDAFPPMDYIMASLDTAYTEKTENDYSAFTVWGVFSRDTVAHADRIIGIDGRPIFSDRSHAEVAPKLMLMYAWQEKLELHELVKKVGADAKKFKCDKVLIENKAAGHSVGQELRRLYANENYTVQLYDPKSQDKTSRLYSVQHLFADGMIYAPDRSWADMVITQVAQFPKGRHDDLVDSAAQGIRHLRDLGLLVRAQERMEEIELAKVYTGKGPMPLYPC